MAASLQRNSPSIGVEVIEDDGDWSNVPDAPSLIARAAEAVAEELGDAVQLAVVAVALSSDANVEALNGQFRGKRKPTNVLSFPAGEGAPEGFLGDVVLASETVRREAEEQRVPLPHHVQHLVVHGILHLLGYDHISAADAERMEALEISILSKLDIANPYTGELETGTKG
ncbi:rRNA maturation RNase YbeY [Hyphomicrobium sp.]|jgi:probable rRNA maturation factor|uniref:rRNA maturation RNase YbeY n=1 Tax=Hyphomicrobium sp. TaxID=82 RepID=UPI002D093AFB|nr:rRNA maturation RNase YbeY [Hyphomicrobium sp.]HVZ05943.1 rRNA maturation RNase YbeY [Hyphomicrobium sp.]